MSKAATPPPRLKRLSVAVRFALIEQLAHARAAKKQAMLHTLQRQVAAFEESTHARRAGE